MTTPTFVTQTVPAGNLNTAYSTNFVISGGTTPYTFALISGSLPPGLTLLSDASGITGTPTTLGIYNFTMQVTDSSSPVQTVFQAFTLLVLDLISLSNLTVDQTQFVTQLQNALSVSQTWSTGLTTQTSQTLIELIAAIGTYTTSRIVRLTEDAFPTTAQSDSAIRAIANMQGLRLARKLPSSSVATISSSTSITIPAYTQFSGGGQSWFNDTQIILSATVPASVLLKEGIVSTFNINGLGSNLQAWVSTDDKFTVSDQDVTLKINNTGITKAFGGLWNYQGLPAFADLTLPDGRLLIQFGSNGYGSIPGVNDVVTITYAKTQGETVNGLNLAGVAVTCSAYPTLTGSFTANPSGGAPEKPSLAYKNFSAGTFGTFGSAVTKPQYQVMVNNYPGIIDSVTQSQREINTLDVRWMNVIRVSALTNSTWTSGQINAYLAYLQSQSMYSTRFLWQAPIPIPVTVNLTAYCFNSVTDLTAVQAAVQKGITNLFAPRPGILSTPFYIDDLITTAHNAAPGQISYVTVASPTAPMLVTLPTPPQLSYTINTTGGTLTGGTLGAIYSYAISVNAASPLGGTDYGPPSGWVFPTIPAGALTDSITLTWPALTNVVSYTIWGRRSGLLQQLTTITAASGITTYTDTGTPADPASQAAFPSPDFLARYNQLASLTVNVGYANRQSRVLLPVRNTLT